MIRIMSFNTQHCLNFKTRQIDFALMTKTIKDLGGEIVGLQEIRGKGVREDYTDQSSELSRLTGYNYYFAKALDVNGENPYGNALLSKYPILSAETIKIPDPTEGGFETRCILKAVVDVGEPLTVIVTHFGLSDAEQKNAARAVEEQIKDKTCVLMGDFNVTPENKHLACIREKMLDTAELFDTQKLSFPSDKPRMKIDYIFVSQDLRAVFADIPDVVASDHRPYICDIEV